MLHPLYLRCFRGCGLGELAGSRVLCLWEQVRDLRVQEFLRELVVGIATPSDLAGLILVKILRSDEGGDVEKVCSNFETILLCWRLLISLLLVFISCMLILFISIICLIFTCTS